MLVYYGRSTESAKTCEAVYKTAIWMASVGGIACHVIIYLHTCALWGRTRFVVFLLGSLLLVASLAVIVLTALQGITIFFLGAYDQPLAPTPGCRIMSRKAPYLQGIYAAGVAAEAVTVVLMLARGLQHVRQSKDSWVFSLYGTGILYCVVILILGIANVVLLSLPAMVSFATVLAPLQHAMKSILCSRLMFAILKRRNMVHRNTVRNLDPSIEQSRIRNVGEQSFTSIEEYPRRTVDVIELQASEGESTGSYNTRAYGSVGSPDPPQVELSR